MAGNVKYIRQGDIHTIELGILGLEKIIIDYTGIPIEQRVGVAKALLSASALACYVATLGDSLEGRGATFESINAEATLSLGPNDVGQGRIKKIALDVAVSMHKDDTPIYNRCAKILSQGCLVTASLHDGIEMEYTLNQVPLR